MRDAAKRHRREKEPERKCVFPARSRRIQCAPRRQLSTTRGRCAEMVQSSSSFPRFLALYRGGSRPFFFFLLLFPLFLAIEDHRGTIPGQAGIFVDFLSFVSELFVRK